MHQYIFMVKCVIQVINITVESCILRIEVAKSLSARPKIDEVDVRILSALLKDSRTSFAEIAKDCEMSTNAIRMRLMRLKEAGIIKGAIMQVNPKSLGYDCIAHLMIQADINGETSVYDFLKKIPNTILKIRYTGRYNILSFVALKNFDELAHNLERVSSHPHVTNVETCIWVDVVQMDHPKNLVIEPFDGLPYTTESVPNNENPKPTIAPPHVASELAEENYFKASYGLDKIDMQITRILSKNARISFRKLAKQLGISTNAVIRRYKRLRKDVAPYSSITLDLGKIGYTCTAVFLINVSHKHEISKVFDKILRVPNIITAIRLLGTVDLFIVAPIANFKQLFKLKQDISKIPGIMKIELLLRESLSTWPRNIFSKLLSKQPQTT